MKCQSMTSSGAAAHVGPNGRMIHDMYLLQVKKPAGQQGAVGLLQRSGDHSRQGSLYRPRQERLRSGEVSRWRFPQHNRTRRRGWCSARGLRRDFGGFTAVKNVDLDVHDASVHALIGPNGAGKTTVFNLLTKFLQPSAGTITLMGTDITKTAAGQGGADGTGAVRFRSPRCFRI